MTFIQRFDSALRLNLHFHMGAIDGVFAAADDDEPQFQALLPPEDEEIERVTASIAERVRKFFERRGLGPDSDPEESDPALVKISGVCSVKGGKSDVAAVM